MRIFLGLLCALFALIAIGFCATAAWWVTSTWYHASIIAQDRFDGLILFSLGGMAYLLVARILLAFCVLTTWPDSRIGGIFFGFVLAIMLAPSMALAVSIAEILTYEAEAPRVVAILIISVWGSIELMGAILPPTAYMLLRGVSVAPGLAPAKVPAPTPASPSMASPEPQHAPLRPLSSPTIEFWCVLDVIEFALLNPIGVAGVRVVGPGTVQTSQGQLARHLDFAKVSVHRELKKLRAEGQITFSATPRGTTIRLIDRGK